MGIQNVSEGDPLSKVTLSIQRRFSQYRPPEKKVEVRRNAPNFCGA